MEKVITRSGINGTFEGKVIVLLNSKKVKKEVRNYSTRTNELRTFYYHFIETNINDRTIDSVLTTEGELTKMTEKLELDLIEELELMANEIPHPILEEKLKSKGYN